jgi:hypothetical protein
MISGIKSLSTPVERSSIALDIRFTALINPFDNPQLILRRDRLLAYGFNQFYRIRQSGLEIELAAAYKVRDMFLAHQVACEKKYAK